MKVNKTATGGRDFAKKGEDINDQDIITIMDGGAHEEGEYGKQFIFTIKLTNGEEKSFPFNKTSMNNLIDAYGDETDDWVGKEAKVYINQENVSGKFVKVAYFTHPQGDLENPAPLAEVQV